MATAQTMAEARGGELTRAVSAEWSKLWSVRSTLWCLLSAIPLLVAWVGINGVALRAQLDAGREGVVPVPATEQSAEGLLYLAQYALIALATLATAGEFATGSIRTTLLWAPVRRRLLLAKGLALAPVCFLSGVVLSVIGTLLASAAVGADGAPTSAGATAGAAVAAGVYLVAAGFIAVALSALVRSVAGALTVAFCLLTLLPLALRAGGTEPVWLPGEAGGDLMTGAAPVLALVVLVAWVAASMTAAVATLQRRDA